jgi:long-chain acyl-CoA synthetase
MSYPLGTYAPHFAGLSDRLRVRGENVVLISGDQSFSASALLIAIDSWRDELRSAGVKAGNICAFEGDYRLETVSLMLALMQAGAIVVPFSYGMPSERAELCHVAGVEWQIDWNSRSVFKRDPSSPTTHPLIENLRASRRPGLIVFTSGSSGKPKAILHDVERVATKFAMARQPWRMLLMLLIDHFGGFNTLLACLFDGGVGICVENRKPETVCKAIATAHAELLPTTPTFLGLLIGSGLWRVHDLSSLKLITYGTEPMPPATLKRVKEVFPNAQLKQTYGLSELGVLRSSSPDSESVWLKIGGHGFETRIVDGELHVRSQSSMLGYLNAPTPIDKDGWMNTGDLVEEKEGLIRFVGRKSDIINVGGQKVFPAEVEDVILEVAGVTQASVRGIRNTVLGNAIVARVSLDEFEHQAHAIERIRDHCRTRLQKFKVPIRFEIVDQSSMSSNRSKKIRT